MIEIHITNVNEPEHREILNSLLAGRFSYEADGKQIEKDEFILKFSLGEYAVVRDELHDKKREELMNNGDSGYQKIHNELPRTHSVEEGESYDIEL
jgi:hypothetical protein